MGARAPLPGGGGRRREGNARREMGLASRPGAGQDRGHEQRGNLAGGAPGPGQAAGATDRADGGCGGGLCGAAGGAGAAGGLGGLEGGIVRTGGVHLRAAAGGVHRGVGGAGCGRRSARTGGWRRRSRCGWGRTCPCGAAPYTREEVLAAVASAHPAIELLQSRFQDVDAVDKLSALADCLSHYGLVWGPAVAGWRAVEYATETGGGGGERGGGEAGHRQPGRRHGAAAGVAGERGGRAGRGGCGPGSGSRRGRGPGRTRCRRAGTWRCGSARAAPWRLPMYEAGGSVKRAVS